MQKKHVAVRKLGTPRSLCGFNHHSELLNRNVSSFFYGYISANSWCLEICFFQLTYERSSFFIWSNPWFCCLNHHNHHSSGWWLTYPSEKWWSPSLGVTIPNWKVIKAMFQSPPTRYALHLYHLLMTFTLRHGKSWKIHPFFTSVNHLFLWAYGPCSNQP